MKGRDEEQEEVQLEQSSDHFIGSLCNLSVQSRVMNLKVQSDERERGREGGRGPVV